MGVKETTKVQRLHQLEISADRLQLARVYDSICGKALIDISVALFVLAVGISAKADPNLKPGSGYLKIETGVIFNATASAKSRVCALEQCWTPSEDDVSLLEHDLPKFFASATDYGSGQILENITQYKRKYFGFKRNGRKFILVSALCKKYWRPASKNFAAPKRPMTDMGPCFFSVDYDLKARKFLDLYIDGEA